MKEGTFNVNSCSIKTQRAENTEQLSQYNITLLYTDILRYSQVYWTGPYKLALFKTDKIHEMTITCFNY